jgi:hypothetical protein
MVKIGSAAASLASFPLNVGRNTVSGLSGAAGNVLRRGSRLVRSTGRRLNGTLKNTTNAVLHGGKRRTNRNRRNKNRSNKNRKNRSNKNRNRH